MRANRSAAGGMTRGPAAVVVRGGSSALQRSLPPPGRVALSLVPGEGLGGHPGVLGQRPDRGMTGAGHQHRRPGAVLGVVSQGGVPELVERGAAGGLLEQGLGLLVAEPGVAVLVKVGGGELHRGPWGRRRTAGRTCGP